MEEKKRFQSLKDFYPFYLSEHQDPASRMLHFVGTGFVILIFFWSLFTLTWWGFLLVPLIGYGFAWAGHLIFEKNKPATIQYPGYNLASDFKFFFDILTGKEKIDPEG